MLPRAGGYPQTPLQAKACNTSINPNPFFIRRGFRPLPKPLANLWQGDVTRKVAETATFLRFGIAGHAIYYLSAGALYCLASDVYLEPLSRSTLCGAYSSLRVLRRGGESRDIKRESLAPKGHRLCERYQNFDEEGFPRNQLSPSI